MDAEVSRKRQEAFTFLPTPGCQYAETFLEYKCRGICHFFSTVRIMAPCNHISLLQIVKGEQVSLVNNERMENLVKEMAWNGSSTVQRPSLQFFIGGEAKNLGLRQIFPQNNFG